MLNNPIPCLMTLSLTLCLGCADREPASQSPQDMGAGKGNDASGDVSSDVSSDAPTHDMPDAFIEDAESRDMESEEDMPILVEPGRSSGCLAQDPGPSAPQRTHTFSTQAGEERSFQVIVPPDYDHSVSHRVIVGYAGTNWSGGMIRPYLDLETSGEAEIYVYPDLKFHDFQGWGNLGGWLLGPHAAPAHGVEDIEFTRELLDLLEGEYCVDPSRVFATGHSWGGDMAAVVGCFLGDRFRAVAPAAANRPYWFEPADGSEVQCVGGAHVWTFFGQNETHFTSQSHPGAYGEEQVAFWSLKHNCSQDAVPLPGMLADECVEHPGCSHQTRYCFYDPATGHQIPSYFSDTVTAWFRSFE